jgi:hypothetical protein
MMSQPAKSSSQAIQAKAAEGALTAILATAGTQGQAGNRAGSGLRQRPERGGRWRPVGVTASSERPALPCPASDKPSSSLKSGCGVTCCTVGEALVAQLGKVALDGRLVR